MVRRSQKWIIPHLSMGKRGFSTRFDLGKIFQLIIKRLKTGCQWRELSLKEYFINQEISWQLIYYFLINGVRIVLSGEFGFPFLKRIKEI